MHKLITFVPQYHGEELTFVPHPSGEGEGEFVPKFRYYNRVVEDREVWGSVCVDKFGDNDNAAQVICRSLGLPSGRNI